MTIETIHAKLSEVRKQKEQILANYNALSGAEQILEQLIQEEQAQSASRGDDTANGDQPQY